MQQDPTSAADKQTSAQ